jgi:hypothetical protein
MSTVTVPRSNVTVEEVGAVLRLKLGSRYRITPSVTSRGFAKEVSDDPNAMLVRGAWLARANVRIVPGADGTEIQVSPGATYPGRRHALVESLRGVRDLLLGPKLRCRPETMRIGDVGGC